MRRAKKADCMNGSYVNALSTAAEKVLGEATVTSVAGGERARATGLGVVGMVGVVGVLIL